MKTKAVFSLSIFCGFAILSGELLNAQEKRFGSFFPGSESRSSREVEAKFKQNQPNFRKGNEDAGEQGYSAYPAVTEEVIPPPPLPTEEPEIVEAPPVTPPPPTPKIKEKPVEIEVEKTYTPPPAPKPKPVVEISLPKPKIPASVPAKKPVVERYQPPVKPTIQARPVPAPPTARPIAYDPLAAAFPSKEQASPNQFPTSPPAMQARPVPPAPRHRRGDKFHHEHMDRPNSNIVALREEANELARQGIQFRFGRSHPAFGGLDSSGAVQYLLNEIGVPGVPRSTVDQSNWVRVNNLLHEFYSRPTVDELTDNLAPGNLIFWGERRKGRISHVMIYLGYDSLRDQHLAFGTRGGTEVGINGNEIDIFDLKLNKERIIATGPVPGLAY